LRETSFELIKGRDNTVETSRISN